MKQFTFAFLALSACLSAIPACASSVSGSANLEGAGGLTFSSSSIVFGTNAAVGGANALTAGMYNSGDFSTQTGGTISNLSNVAAGAGVDAPAFATINTAAGPIYFDLFSVLPGTGTLDGCTMSNPLGSLCTPAGSPYLLVGTYSTAGQPETVVQFSLSGITYLGSSVTGAAPALFTFQSLVPLPLDTVLRDLPTGVQAAGSSASLTSLAPEPADMGLAAAGLLALTALRRRRRS